MSITENSNNNESIRLHKFSPLFILIAAVKQAIIPLLVGSGYYRMSDNMEFFLTVLIIFGALFPVLTYWFYHYWIKDDFLEIKEGIFFKKNRKIPYTRIQNVNVSQGPLQRILKVATLQLESASGGKPEAIMRVVDLGVVEQIKLKVKQSSQEQSINLLDNEENIDEPTPVLHSLNTREVITYGIISQRGMVIGAIVFGFMAQNQKFMEGLVKYFNQFFQLPDFTKITLAQSLVYVSVIGLFIFLSLQFMSIMWALLKFHQFEISKQHDRLHATMGLLSKISATIPLKRIQLYRLSENPLHKLFKAKTITIETAGGVNTDKAGIVMRWLAPYINKAKVPEFMAQIEEKISYNSIDWQNIPTRAWRRVIKRSLIQLFLFSLVLLTLASIPTIEVRFYAWVLIICMIPMTYFYAKKYVKKTAYFINGDIICFKSGIWFSKQSIVKISKIQTVEIIESYFDRKNKMATLEIDTAGSNPLLHHVKIPYLEVGHAYKLRNFINKKLNLSQFDW